MSLNHWLATGAVVFLAACTGILLARPFDVVPRGGQAPGFILTDSRDQPLFSQDLQGHETLYTFMYTRCGAACQPTTSAMQQIQQRVAALASTDNPPVSLVSLSFDPQHDTPEALQTYAAQVRADPQRWRFATAAPDTLKIVIGDGFKTFYEPKPDGTYLFDSKAVLVDDQGYIRTTYRTNTPDVERMLRDIDAVVEEARKSRGAQHYVYETAHLFTCSLP